MTRKTFSDVIAIACSPSEMADLCRHEGLLARLDAQGCDTPWEWDVTDVGGTLLVPPPAAAWIAAEAAKQSDTLDEADSRLVQILEGGAK